jgi:hypothetical protein
MNTLQAINEKLKAASLTDSQMALWSDVLNNLTEASLRDIFDFIESDNKTISILTDNLVAKEEAIKDGDIEQFEQVLKNDTAIVNSI